MSAAIVRRDRQNGRGGVLRQSRAAARRRYIAAEALTLLLLFVGCSHRKNAVSGTIEVDAIYTTATADGRLFYLIAIAPEDEYKTYQPAFDHIIGSLQLAR